MIDFAAAVAIAKLCDVHVHLLTWHSGVLENSSKWQQKTHTPLGASITILSTAAKSSNPLEGEIRRETVLKTVQKEKVKSVT